MASYPTYKPSVYVGRIDPEKLAPLVNDAAAKAANFPGLNRVTQVAYPPGSTWKPVTALAAMQEHLLSPYSSIQCTPTAEYGRDKQVFKNWDPFVNRPMNLPEALATSCDTYFYDVGNRFYEGGAAERSRLQQWARKFGFGAPDRARHRQRGAVVADDRADARLAEEDVQERLGQGLEPGRLDPARDRAEGRHRDAAADGALLRDDRERRQARDARTSSRASSSRARTGSSPSRCSSSRPIRRATPASTRRRCRRCARACGRRPTRPNGTSSGVFGTYPISISGKTGTAEKVVNLPGYPVGHLEDQSWWCGYGPSDDAQLVVCAVIENGGHGSSAAAPGGAPRLREVLQPARPAPRRW